MLRNFSLRDQQAVQSLILDGLRERWGDRYDPTFNRDLDDVAGTYLEQGAEVVVIENGGQIVATGVLVPESHGRGRVVRMSVDARYRRQGLGRSVVEELVRRARHRGMRELLVLTDTPWASALALYRACGFVEVGRDETDTHFEMVL